MKNILIGLNEKQKEFVLSDEKRILLLACAGSGKSNSTVRKIAHFLLEKRISPEKIFAISFTRAASNELSKRIIKLNKSKGPLVKSMTFHSMCIYFLKKYINSNFSLINDSEKVVLKNNISKSFNITKFEKSKEAQKAYELELIRSNLLDIDLVPGLFKNKLIENELFKANVQKEIKCLFYDEGQDLNAIQYEVIKLLIPKESNKTLCFIGDFSQNIYSWNGTDNKLLIEFKDYYNAKVIKLYQNYRCSKEIIEFSNKFVKDNDYSIDVEGFFNSDPIEYKKMSTLNFEVLLISTAYKSIISNKTLAIIARNNSDIDYISSVLSNAGLEHTTSRKKQLNKRFLNFAKVCINPNSLLLEEFINIDNKSRLESLEQNIPLIDILAKTNTLAKNIKDYNITIKKSGALKAYTIIKNVFNIYNDDVEAAIIEFEKNFNQNDLETFLEIIESKNDQDNLSKSKVICTTIHGSKGLEYDEVILYNVNNNNFKKSDLEENLRLLYVATTRAISKLTITYIIDKQLEYNKKIPEECTILKELLN